MANPPSHTQDSAHPTDGVSGSITVITGDGVSFSISRAAALHSIILEPAAENPDFVEPFPLPEVHSSIMPDMIRWLEHHAVYPTPNSGDNARAAPAWDTLFVNSLGNEKIFTMIVAVNYLEIKELLDLCVTKVADMIKGKNPTEIKTMFDLDSDSGVYDEMIGVEATAEDHHG